MRWLITGANGNLGRQLIPQLLQADDHSEVVAVVRSASARAAVEGIVLEDTQRPRLSVVELDYVDVAAIKAAAEGCSHVVHLVGILKASKTATYQAAHEDSCTALVSALQDSSVEHISYMSIVGSRPDSKNACLASKGRAEQILAASKHSVAVLRVPMVLGEGDYASFALSKSARKSVAFGFRTSSLEQPIYAPDVVSAIFQAGQLQVDAALDLGGPEILSRRALILRAGQVLGTQPRVVSLPIGLGMAMAGLFEALLGNPPVTQAMLGVLDHDDNVDSQSALTALQMEGLTDLDTMLDACLVR